MIPYIVAGIVLGSIYALAASGIVLTYSTSRVLNFSHGATAYFVAVFYYHAVTVWGWPRGFAALISIVILSPTLGLVLWGLVFRFLTSAAPETTIVATTGLLIAIPAITSVLFGSATIYAPIGLIPASTGIVDVFAVRVSYEQIVVVGAMLLLALVMGLAMRYSEWGLRTRAIVDAPETAPLYGLNVARDTAISWVIGMFLAGLAGVLIAPIVGLDADGLTLLVVASFGTALAARFVSLPRAFVAGVVLGVVQEIPIKYVPPNGVLAVGLRPSIPFVFMFVLLVYFSLSKGVHREKSTVARAAASTKPAVAWVRRARETLVVAAVAALPFLVSDFWLGVVVTGVALAVIFLSFTIVTGEGAMVSLGQAAIVAIGAVGTAFAHSHGWPLILAVPVSALVAVPIGGALALLAGRLGDLYLALATLAFAVLMQYTVLNLSIFQGQGTGITVAPPALGSSPLSNLALYALFLLVFAAAAGILVALRRSTSGLLWSALRTSEVATAALGYRPLRTRVALFSLGAFVGAIGGGLYVIQLSNSDPTSFEALVGVTWLAIIVIMGVRSVPAALVAGVSYTVIAQLATIHLGITGTQLLPVLWGIGAVLVAKNPDGALAMYSRQIQGLWSRFRGHHADLPPMLPDKTHEGGEHTAIPMLKGAHCLTDRGALRCVKNEIDSPVLLEARGISVNFGGAQALIDVDVTVTEGAAMGLIGPNGAGKTTLLAVLSGFVSPSAGSVTFVGRDITSAAPPVRAQMGLARTFQRAELFTELTVAQHVILGYRSRHPRVRLARGRRIGGPLDDHHEDSRVAAILSELGLDSVADRTVGELPIGTCRLVEVARAIATEPRLLMLDEPAAGLDARERQRLGEVIARLRSDAKLALLFVEHDFDMLAEICDHITVLDFGFRIALGTPQEIRMDDSVQAAYLGNAK